MVARGIINKINENKNFILKGGAGSGKTYTLIEVIEKLILLNKKVAVITYTNVAKEEIIERLNKKGNSVSFCGTTHEFIWGIISNFQNELNDVCKNKFSDDIIEDYNYQIIYDFGYHHIDNTKYKIKLSHDEVIEIFLLMANNYKGLYKIISNIYDCILVDEFQDTKPDIIEVLLNEDMSISCGFFGDPVQGIYATEELNMNDTEVIIKDDNWRSSTKLINFFNDVRRKINNDEVIQNSLNNNICNYESKLLYYEVEQFTKEIKEQIENDNNIKINHSLFLTHNLGLGNQIVLNREYNNKFNNNQRKFGKREEIYQHLDFFFDLYEMKNNNFFETEFVKKYFQIDMINKEVIVEWENKIKNLMTCTKIKEIKELEYFDILTDKIKLEITELNDEMNIEYFYKMYEYSKSDNVDRTIFSMKGLEADNILIYLNNGKWSKYNFKTLNEETKKILYVAITRAKKNLIIVSNVGIDESFKSIILDHFEQKVY